MDTTPSIALVIRESTPLSDDHCLADILDFFGIPWTALTIKEAKEGYIASLTAGHSRFSIITSAMCLADVLLPDNDRMLPTWLTEAASVFVYGFQNSDTCRNLLREITGDIAANISSFNARPITLSIADAFPEMCGPMSGIQLQLEPGAIDSLLTIKRGEEIQSIVAAPEGYVFVGIRHAGMRLYCDASQKIVSIHRRSAAYFDVKKCFAGAVPLVMYLKWTFRDICWTTQETNACLIIDDPLLKPRYGFFDYHELVQLMNKETFATTVAFIPWNWRRTNRDTIATFQDNSEKLSVCVHGCDHTKGEFATRSTDMLGKKLETANCRMNTLLEKTMLNYDQIMVFPQGAFSPETGPALKDNGFVAAVNTEVAPANYASNETTIADLWSVAILRYGSFAIFTRRYITHGIENFAFDGLLGKPCFVVAHHELFRDHGTRLLEFLRKLNSLNWRLCWRTLGKAVCRSYGIQRRNGKMRVKMFAERLLIENKEAVTQQITVMKEEVDIGSVKGVMVNHEAVHYEHKNGYLQFRVTIPPMSTAEIGCTYHKTTQKAASSVPILYTCNVAARRYLSEFRDNYISRNDFLYKSAVVIKRLLK